MSNWTLRHSYDKLHYEDDVVELSMDDYDDDVSDTRAAQMNRMKRRDSGDSDSKRSRSQSSIMQSCPTDCLAKADYDKVLRGRWVRYARHHSTSLFICLLIVLFPVLCIYVGYSIGTYFMPAGYRRFPDPGVIIDMGQLNYSWYNTHNLTIDFVGGLGNQMFQYAALYGIAKANGLKPVVNEQAAVARIFRALKAQRTNTEKPGKGSSAYLERKPNAFDSRTFSLNFMRNIHLDGFFQSWRYFDHVQSDMRKQFSFRSAVVTEADEFLASARDEYMLSEPVGFDASMVKFIGVHIRRGDFLESYNEEKGYTVADHSYLTKALRYYENKYKTVIFVVCSDDMEWSRANVKPTKSKVVFSNFKSAPFHDMCLLSRCNHSIITVGTFGWWGAWLAGGETVYYRDFPRQGSMLRDYFRFGDYYLQRWIAM